MAASSVTSLFSLCTLSPPISPSKFPPSGVSLPLSAKNPLSPLNIVPSSQIMPVVCQSLAYNVQVIVDDNEPEEKLLGRFRREVMRAGVIQECKRRRFFENKQDERKRKHREAAKRNRRRRPQFRTGPQDRQVVSKSSKREDDEDNWDLPSGDDIPYLS